MSHLPSLGAKSFVTCLPNTHEAQSNTELGARELQGKTEDMIKLFAESRV